jgi:hypothetical protein
MTKARCDPRLPESKRFVGSAGIGVSTAIWEGRFWAIKLMAVVIKEKIPNARVELLTKEQKCILR